MQKIQILTLYVTIGILSACGSSQSTYNQNQNPHTEPHIKVHEDYIRQKNFKAVNEKLVKEISGIYEGDIPCVNCGKRIYTLQLNEDFTYSSKLSYQDKSKLSEETKGTFIITMDQVIELDTNSDGVHLLKKTTEGLWLLDDNGKEITGDLANKYLLLAINETSKINETNLDKKKLNKWKQGIYAYGHGDAPFWTAEIGMDQRIHFRTINGIDFTSPPVQPTKSMETDITRYNSITNMGEIIIQINNSPCTDFMEDERFQFSVKIDYKSKKEKNYRSFGGCGNYVPDFGLHKIWIIEKIGETDLNSVKFNKESPRIELFMEDGKVLGNDGCNDFSGNVEVQNGFISFGDLAGTMMACTNMDISLKITKVLSGKRLRYKLINNELTFFDKDIKVMILNRID